MSITFFVQCIAGCMPEKKRTRKEFTRLLHPKYSLQGTLDWVHRAASHSNDQKKGFVPRDDIRPPRTRLPVAISSYLYPSQYNTVFLPFPPLNRGCTCPINMTLDRLTIWQHKRPCRSLGTVPSWPIYNVGLDCARSESIIAWIRLLKEHISLRPQRLKVLADVLTRGPDPTTMSVQSVVAHWPCQPYWSVPPCNLDTWVESKS